MKHNSGYFQSFDGVELFYQSWHPEDGTKIVFIGIHGAFAHSGDFTLPASFFTKHGVAVYSFDIRGFGTWKGKSAHISSYEHYLNDMHSFKKFVEVREPNVTQMHMVGHSMGGMLTLLYGITHPTENLTSLIVSSPWLGTKVKINPILRLMAGLFSVIYPRFSSPNNLDLTLLTHDKDVVARHEADIESGLRKTHATARWFVQMQKAQKFVLENAAQIKFPTLVLQAGADEIVDKSLTKKMYESLTTEIRDYKEYEGFYHELFNEIERERVYNDILNWIQQF